MIPPKDKAKGMQPLGSKQILHLFNFTITRRVSPFTWRKKKGLLTLSDHVFIYRSIRSPRGAYRTPLIEDLI